MTGFGPLVPFLIASLTTILLVPVARAVARPTGFIATPRADRIHRVATPLLGGAACLLGIAAGVAVSSLLLDRIGSSAAGAIRAITGPSAAGAGNQPFPLVVVWAGAGAFFALGLWDDRFPLRAVVKGTVEGILLAGVILLWQPQGHLASVPAQVLLWFAGMILLNAWNYIDHADGLFAVNAIASSAILAVWGGWLGAGAGTLALLVAVAGACAGFLAWNRPPAKIFLGDAGSLALGFILVAAAAWCVDRGGVAAIPAAAGAHGIVAADFLLVTSARLRRRANIFVGGCEHSGHRLAARIGIVPTLMFFTGANVLFGLLAVSAGRGWPEAASVLLALLVILLAIGCSRLRPPRPEDDLPPG